MVAKKQEDETDGNGAPRVMVSQTDVPRHTLKDALRVPMAISENYAKRPTKPLRVAEALGMPPTTTTFRTLTSASAAYGVTTGTAWATEIALTDLGRRIVAPTVEGDDLKAKREAFLKPRVIGEFMHKYDGSRLPNETIGMNVLEELGLARSATKRAFDLVRNGAQELGLLRTIRGQDYVDLQGTHATPANAPEIEESIGERPLEKVPVLPESASPVSSAPLSQNRRVFITHGQDKEIAQQLKEMLTFGNFEPIMSVERETGAKPVPDKVLDDMRGCAAAIVHVGAETKLLDTGGKEHLVLNPNVLIEIGAAMALYGRRFILLVERGVTLPSNLLGLYEVRYEGSRLDYDATMKLLKAFNEFQK